MNLKINSGISLSEAEEVLLRQKIDDIHKASRNSDRNESTLTVFFANQNTLESTIKVAIAEQAAILVYLYSKPSELTKKALVVSNAFLRLPLNPEQIEEELLHLQKKMPLNRIQAFAFGERDEQTFSFSKFSGNEKLRVKVEDIIFVESDGSITVLHFFTNNKLHSKKINHTISECEEILPAKLFFRVHRQFLMNGKSLHEKTEKGIPNVITVADKTIPIARRRKALLRKWMKENILELPVS